MFAGDLSYLEIHRNVSARRSEEICRVSLRKPTSNYLAEKAREVSQLKDSSEEELMTSDG